MNILVLNAGSSSLKWKLFEINEVLEIASGLIEGIGETQSSSHLEYKKASFSEDGTITTHKEAFTLLFKTLQEREIIDLHTQLDAIGHRVVHGGETFTQPTHITPDVLATLKTLTPLAPLHNPANILGIESAISLAKDIPNIAVFDTAFHSTLPPHAYLYAIDKTLYTQAQIRRYGFHGTSHHYVAQACALKMQKPLKDLNLITLHLGNGASACAIEKGESIDTSMGFTPLEGLVMGTRSGDIDPAIVTYLMQQKGFLASDVEHLLNKESGLKGLCGDNDMRSIIERSQQGDLEARQALAIFAYRIKKYIGAYMAILGEVDAIIFTGGIGEHAPLVRTLVLQNLEKNFGIVLDEKANKTKRPSAIHATNSHIKIFVIPTNEELSIAQETAIVTKLLTKT